MYMYAVTNLSRIHYFFFFNDTATTEIYTLSLHDALPIYLERPLHGPHHHRLAPSRARGAPRRRRRLRRRPGRPCRQRRRPRRSEEHTSELQSRQYLVCRLLLEKKKNNM